MANWVHNKLKISGSKEDMLAFYKVLNSDNTSEFSMQKFFPVPEILCQDYVNHCFQVSQTVNVIVENDKIVTKEIDSQGRTKKEFEEFKSTLEATYGFDNCNDWCTENWGCQWDVDCVTIIKNDNTEYCILYETPWDHNIEFVKFGLNFHNLQYQLDYSDSCLGISGTFISGKECCLSKYNVLRFLFVEKVDNEKYMFIKDYCFENSKDTYMYIPILDLSWEKSLEDNNLSKNNIVNWDDLCDYFNSIEIKSKEIYKFKMNELFLTD